MNEGLFYGTKLDHSLLNPNQIRHFGNLFQDNPFDKNQPLSITCPESLEIPLENKGTKIRFNSRVPTDFELETIPETQRVHLTSPTPWNPSTVHLSMVISNQATPEKNITDRAQAIAEVAPDGDHILLSSVSSAIMDLKYDLASNVHVHTMPRKRKIEQLQPLGDKSKVDIPARRTMVSCERHAKVSAEELAEL